MVTNWLHSHVKSLFNLSLLFFQRSRCGLRLSCVSSLLSILNASYSLLRVKIKNHAFGYQVALYWYIGMRRFTLTNVFKNPFFFAVGSSSGDVIQKTMLDFLSLDMKCKVFASTPSVA